jgi:predicted 3-demethylubiquinone-9 3-methyltransferase (glyoxalase superfamily)
MASKNIICLCFDGDALDAATFYAETFPDRGWTLSIKRQATTRRASRVMS